MKTVIVDSQAVGHAAKHRFKDLSHLGRQTGVIYGFLSSVLSLSKKLNTTKFLFAWDSRDSKRKKIYPGYKKRDPLKDTSEEDKRINENAFQQFYELRAEILPSLGFNNNFIERGYEADDIIASIVMFNPGTFIVASEDQDLYQLLDYCSMWKIRTKKLYTREDFEEQWGIVPLLWTSVKAYSGCVGDKVPGIPNIGAKSVIAWMKGKLKGDRLQSILTVDKQIIERNKKLTWLPFKDTPAFNEVSDNITIDKVLKTCEDLGLYSLLKDSYLKTWKTFTND